MSTVGVTIAGIVAAIVCSDQTYLAEEDYARQSCGGKGLENIVTPTRYSDPGWWTGGLTKAQFEARHVFFQKEDPDTYIGKILAKVVASTVSVEPGAPA